MHAILLSTNPTPPRGRVSHPSLRGHGRRPFEELRKARSSTATDHA